MTETAHSHIRTYKYPDRNQPSNAPSLRCSALLLPRIEMIFSSSVPNLPSPAAYNSCSGRYTLSHSHSHNNLASRGFISAHRSSSGDVGQCVEPKTAQETCFFLNLSLPWEKNPGFHVLSLALLWYISHIILKKYHLIKYRNDNNTIAKESIING